MASAADIITYTGVPLAVIGVLPTLYIFFRSFITLRDIRRSLAKNNVDALTRSSMLTGIVELEIARKSISPLHRFDPSYFGTNELASELKGGSWTTLNWRELPTGTKSYRLQYHDELEQPAAEVDFEELVAFLLDRGAVANVPGFADLRAAGLWTPAGTVLLKSPRTADAVLRTATSEDSDGKLALVMEWRHEWDARSVHDLPPYWMRLRAPEIGKSLGLLPETEAASNEDKTENEKTSGPDTKTKKHHSAHLSIGSAKHLSHLSSHTHRASVSSVHSRLSHISQYSHRSALSRLPDSTPSIRLRLSPTGDTTLLTEPSQYPLKAAHLNPPHPIAPFFATLTTSLAQPHGSLWSFTPPPDLLSLCQTPSIPAGVLVLLELLPEDAAPTWRTSSLLDNELDVMAARQKQDERLRAMMDESRMPAADAQRARTNRLMDETRAWQYEQKRRVVEEARRLESEMVEALASQRMGAGAVAAACCAWLVEQGFVEEKEELGAVVQRVLWECVVRREVADVLGRVLAEWKVWAESGGMTKVQFELVKQRKLEFAYAACLLHFVGEALGNEAGSMTSDLQDCLRMWRKVRLG